MNAGDVQQRIRWATFALLAGLAIILTILDQTGNMDVALNFIRNPLTVMAAWTGERADALADALAGPRDLQTAKQEIERLEGQVAMLEREVEEAREVQGEYQLLLDLFNTARQTPEYRRTIAMVIGRDTNPAVRSIIIDKGANDGVRVGMPVESARGLVGQVFRTTPNAAQVVLLTESSSRIPARLGNSRATGILLGGGVGGLMFIDWVDLKYQIEIGEVVMTSGLGGKFPPDLTIGRVIEIERREAELFQRAVVQAAVDVNDLEMVFVIVDFTPTDISIFETSP
jgi:rod shape-determining protein MreC